MWAVSLTAAGEPSLEGWGGYLHAPMSDGAKVDEPLLRKVADFVTADVLAGEPTLVMCRAGRNRTGLVVCRSLVDVLGVSGEEALRIFREKRPRGVANAAFERYLVSVPRPRR
jgi:protein-tyrosine phosphatase